MRKIEWLVNGTKTMAATPESAAKNVLGAANYGFHWEASKTIEASWYGDLSALPVATSEKGTFYLFLMEHG
jgi:hypothetical protein